LLSGQVASKAIADLLHNVRLALGTASSQRSTTQPPEAGLGTVAARKSGQEAGRPLQLRMAQAWQQHRGPKLVVLSGNDYTAKEFADIAVSDALWRANLARPDVSRFDVEGADHTFSEPGAQRAVEERTFTWLLQSLAPDAHAALHSGKVAGAAPQSTSVS
jgi:hypothetical protein